MKKCPEGGFGTVEARIPFSQSVDCGPTMETRALLESRAVDGPALTRDATAGGNFCMGDWSYKRTVYLICDQIVGSGHP